jgi:hypothetical protein
MPTIAQAKKAWEHGRKSKQHYDALTSEQKSAFWDYGYGQGLIDANTLDDYKKSEFNRYSTKTTRFAPQQVSGTKLGLGKNELGQDVPVKKLDVNAGVYDRHAFGSNYTPTNPQVINAPKPSTQVVKKAMQLEEKHLTPLPVKSISPKTEKQIVTGKGSKTVNVQGKLADKDLQRPDNPFAPALVNFANTASLGALERNTNAIDQLREKAPISSTIGSMAGYLAPFSAAKGALVKGAQTIGKRLLTDAGIGIGLDTATEAIKGKNDLGTAAKNVAMGAAFGIAADGALTILGKLAKNFTIPKDLETEIKREVGAFKIDADGNVYKNGTLVRKLNKGGGGDAVASDGKQFVDQYGNVKGTAETDLQLPQPKPKSQNEWVDSLSKYETVPGPNKAIIENVPISKEVPKISIRKENIALNDEEKYLSKAIKEAGVTIDDFINETQTAIKQIEDEHLAYLRNTGGQGVEQGGIYRDDMGKVKGAFGKTSNNPEWYREFYALNKRKPTVAEMKELTIEHLTKGFGDKFDNIPANDEYIRLKQDLEKYVALKRKSELQPLAKPNNVYEEISTSNTTQKGLQPTQRLIPTTLQQQVQKPNNSLLKSTQLTPSRNIERPFALSPLEQNRINPIKAPQTPLQPLKPLADTNTQPTIKSGLKPNVDEIGNDLLNDATYKELTDELKGANVSSDDTIKAMATNIKDKAGLTLNLKDMYRNMRDIFGKSYDYVKKNYVDPFDASKKAYTDEVKHYTDDIYNKVVKGLKINKGTPESAAIQNFGEGLISKEDLVNQFGEQKAKDIIAANDIFRKAYKELIDKVNTTVKQIYPNNPDKIVPERTDYYRHFTEMAEGFKGLKNIFDTPANIDPKLAGMSEFTKPNTKWASFKQKRGNGEYTADAVGGFLDYIQPAAYSIHIDPHISKFRNLAKDIAEATQATKNANNTIKYLNDFANSLAGKTSKYDRVLQEDIPGGRVAFNAINWLNSRVKANQVLGNASSSLSQFANIPIGVARIKNPVHLTKGVGQTLAGIVGKGNSAMKQSQFVNERNIGDLLSRFDKKLINQPKKFAAWLLGGADKLGTNFIWNSAYNNAVAKNIGNPVKYADDLTRSIVAGRGIGEVPLLQQSKSFQLLAPFQLEVANLWQVMGDSVKEKDFAGIALLLLGNYLFNNATEGLTGNRVTFDPIDAMVDALNEEEATAGKVAGRLAGEVLSNVPLGQTLAATYPEYGADITTPLGSVSLPSRQELFGDNDPTRFGGGLLVTKALSDPLYKIAPPFGGAQAKKTIEGLTSLNKGMVEKNGKMSFPVEKNTENALKSALFGKYSTKEAREYFDKDRRPLSEKQTQDLLKKPNIKGNYEKLMNERKVNTLKNKIKEVKENKKLTPKEKQEKISSLQKEISNILSNK